MSRIIILLVFFIAAPTNSIAQLIFPVDTIITSDISNVDTIQAKWNKGKFKFRTESNQIWLYDLDTALNSTSIDTYSFNIKNILPNGLMIKIPLKKVVNDFLMDQFECGNEIWPNVKLGHAIGIFDYHTSTFYNSNHRRIARKMRRGLNIQKNCIDSKGGKYSNAIATYIDSIASPRYQSRWFILNYIGLLSPSNLIIPKSDTLRYSLIPKITDDRYWSTHYKVYLINDNKKEIRIRIEEDQSINLTSDQRILNEMLENMIKLDSAAVKTYKNKQINSTEQTYHEIVYDRDFNIKEILFIINKTKKSTDGDSKKYYKSSLTRI